MILREKPTKLFVETHETTLRSLFRYERGFPHVIENYFPYQKQFAEPKMFAEGNSDKTGIINAVVTIIGSRIGDATEI